MLLYFEKKNNLQLLNDFILLFFTSGFEINRLWYNPSPLIKWDNDDEMQSLIKMPYFLIRIIKLLLH